MLLREKIVKALLFISITAMVLSIFFPYWQLKVTAPQYPKGLKVTVFLNHVEGDVGEIDILNHYIGMRSLYEAAQIERKLAIAGIAGILICLVVAFFISKKKFFFLLLPAILFPLFFMGDLYYWLRDFGLNLSPHAPLSSSVKPFIPPLFGTGKIAQFHAMAQFDTGFFLTVAASVLILITLILRLIPRQSRCIKIAGIIFFILTFPFIPNVFAKTIIVDSSSNQNLQKTIDQAESGDTLDVKPGIYAGPIHVKKSIHLIGETLPIIDAQGKGSGVYLEAADILFKGFIVRNTGDVLSTEDSGLWATGERICIEDNRFENVLFGIYLKQAPFGVVRNNSLISKPLDIARRGDLIRVWYSDDVLIEKNFATQGRDVVLWFSKNMKVLNNQFQESRYGLHFMYCQQAVVEHNKLSHNSVGAYLMYSAGLQLRENILLENRGPSGYGIGFKDMDGAVIEKNSIVGNRVGFFLDSCAKGLFQNNMIALNDIGMQVIPTASNNQFSENNFIENGEQILLDGSSAHTVNDWNHNHWSDYRGFDANQDGVGDVAYHPMKLFERIADRYHTLKVFYGSPSISAIDFAATTFPIFQPTSKFVDEFPVMQAFKFNGIEKVPSHALPWIFLSVSFFLPMLGFSGRALKNKNRIDHISESFFKTTAEVVIRTEGLTKQFNKLKAISDLDLEVCSGEVVALWGPNGAGKTTLLRCLLGIIPCQGKMEVLGMEVRKNPKGVRRAIGYVPQEIRLHLDHSVLDTVRFYARLRRVSDARIDQLIHEWGLEEVSHKLVQNLSGGMRQKLAVVIALLSDPPILFLDEPTSHLDVKTRGEFLQSLQKLKNQGKTLIFCSHRWSEVRQMADRIIVLEAGVKKRDGKLEEFKDLLAEEISMRLSVQDHFLKEAQDILTKQGFKFSQRENDLWILVGRDSKIEPIRLLIESGVCILNFDME